MDFGNHASFLGKIEKDEAFLYTRDHRHTLFTDKDNILIFPIPIARLDEEDDDFPRVRYEVFSDENKTLIRESNYEPPKIVFFLSQSPLSHEEYWYTEEELYISDNIIISCPDTIADSIVQLAHLMLDTIMRNSNNHEYKDLMSTRTVFSIPLIEVEKVLGNKKIPIRENIKKTIIESKMYSRFPKSIKKTVFPLFFQTIERKGIMEATNKLSLFFLVNELASVYLQDNTKNLSISQLYEPVKRLSPGTYDNESYTHKVTQNHTNLMNIMHKKYNDLDITVHDYTNKLASIFFDNEVIKNITENKTVGFSLEHFLVNNSQSEKILTLKVSDFLSVTRKIIHNKKDNSFTHNGELSYADKSIFGSIDVMFNYYFHPDNFHSNITMEEMDKGKDKKFIKEQYEKCSSLGVQIYQVINDMGEKLGETDQQDAKNLFAIETMPKVTKIATKLNNKRKLENMITPLEIGLTSFLLSQVQWASEQNPHNKQLTQKEIEKNTRLIFTANKNFFEKLSVYTIMKIAHSFVSYNYTIPLPLIKNMIVKNT